MPSDPILPTEARVREACERFDKENAVTERALGALFGQYRTNDNDAHVLLKVVTLNRLYSTGIFAVHDVARHIYEQHEEIDKELRGGTPKIVDMIAKVTMSSGKGINFYSFASKYCSWHKPDKYPIWDSRVNRYLRSLRCTNFAKYLTRHGELWNVYPEFVEIMNNFQSVYRLEKLNFKCLDKFLWTYGGDESTNAQAVGTQKRTTYWTGCLK
jgi:hypothetical protein